MLKHLDLFSGIGGFALAANAVGFETVGFAEVDTFCSAVLKKHWPTVPNFGDIKKLNYSGALDLITGGFPCQPFSVAGKKKGKDDGRYLWPEFIRIIKQAKPTWVVAENVPGIVDMELDNIWDDLEASNYEATAFIVPACAARAPHRRDRLWIVANAMCQRRNVRPSDRQERYLQSNFHGDIKKIQSEWQKFKPKSWQAFNTQEWLESTADTQALTRQQAHNAATSISGEQETRAGFSPQDISNKTLVRGQENEPPIPGVDDGLPDTVDRNKALGNAIVPQVVYPILALIYAIETNRYLSGET